MRDEVGINDDDVDVDDTQLYLVIILEELRIVLEESFGTVFQSREE